MNSHNLRITGIIVEYNPFHNGHIHHIEKARELTQCDLLIAVMSPHFVQRGEPSIVNKWVRTDAAIRHGVDLVLELPTHLVLQSAEIFARSAISILKRAGVDTIVYGSESLDTPILNTLNIQSMKSGNSYAKSKNKDNKGANAILGAYYEKFAALNDIATYRILRTNAYHDLSLNGSIASASAIRYGHENLESTAKYTPMQLSELHTHYAKDYYTYIRYALIAQNDTLSNHFMVSEGIENLLTACAFKNETWEAFLQSATSRRYTSSRIRRTLFQILINTPSTMQEQTSVRVLGMNTYGQRYLRTQKKKGYLTPSFKNYQFKDFEERATFVYALPYPSQLTTLMQREKEGPIIVLDQ